MAGKVFHSNTAGSVLIGRRRQAQLQQIRVSSSTISHVDASKTLYRANVVFQKPMGAFRLGCIYAVALTSFGMLVCDTMTSLFQVMSMDSAQRSALQLTTLVGTACFCGVFVALYQRELLACVLRTFNFTFSSAHCSIALLCLCDMMQWDMRCLSVLTWWIWFHWLLCLDALTPTTRNFLQFKKIAAMPVLVAFLYSIVAMLVLLIYVDDDALRNRVLWRRTATNGSSTNDRIFLSSASILVGRLSTMLLWNAQLIWTVGVHVDNELVLLRDLVEYTVPNDVATGGNVVNKTATINAVAPNPVVNHPSPVQ